MVMGCYGIGVSRVVAAAIEQGHDKDGILWPAEIAPFSVAVVVLDEADDAKVRPAVDSRREGAGKGRRRGPGRRPRRQAGREVQGYRPDRRPYRLVISKRTLEAGEVEFPRRGSADAGRWKLDEGRTVWP